MKASDEKMAAESREMKHEEKVEQCRRVVGRRVPPQPARDDRSYRGPWRPGMGFVETGHE